MNVQKNLKLFQVLFMSKYEIRMTDRKGHGSILLVEADSIEKAKDLSIEKANKFLDERRYFDKFRSFMTEPYKAIRTVNVVEVNAINERKVTDRDGNERLRYDYVTKRKGNKFQLELRYLKLTYDDGSVESNEWYVTKD